MPGCTVSSGGIKCPRHGEKKFSHVYAEAASRDPAERPAFLEQVCGSDHELRKEVESLLVEADGCSRFLSSSGFESALRSVVESGESPLPVPPSSLAPRRPVFFWLAFAAGIAMLGFYACAGWIMYRGVGQPSFGWDFSYEAGRWKVSKVDSAGPAAELHPGDTILAFDGDARAGKVGPEIYRQFLPRGSDYRVRISRQGKVWDYQLRASSTEEPGGVSENTLAIILSVAFYASALILALIKPAHRVAKVGFASNVLTALRCMPASISGSVGVAAGLPFVLNKIIWLGNPWPVALSYDFFYRLTAASNPERSWRALNRFLYAVCAALLGAQIVFLVAGFKGRETLVSMAYHHFWITELNVVFLRSFWHEPFRLIGLAGIIAVVVMGYRRSRDADLRRRIRWIAFPCAVEFAPFAAYVLAGLVLRVTGRQDLLRGSTWSDLGIAVNALLILIPVSLTYAVLKPRLLDIRVIIRRGVRYVLARRILQALLILPALGLIVPIASRPDSTLRDLMRRNSSIATLAATSYC